MRGWIRRRGFQYAQEARIWVTLKQFRSDGSHSRAQQQYWTEPQSFARASNQECLPCLSLHLMNRFLSHPFLSIIYTIYVFFFLADGRSMGFLLGDNNWMRRCVGDIDLRYFLLHAAMAKIIWHNGDQQGSGSAGINCFYCNHNVWFKDHNLRGTLTNIFFWIRRLELRRLFFISGFLPLHDYRLDVFFQYDRQYTILSPHVHVRWVQHDAYIAWAQVEDYYSQLGWDYPLINISIKAY